MITFRIVNNTIIVVDDDGDLVRVKVHTSTTSDYNDVCEVFIEDDNSNVVYKWNRNQCSIACSREITESPYCKEFFIQLALLSVVCDSSFGYIFTLSSSQDLKDQIDNINRKLCGVNV